MFFCFREDFRETIYKKNFLFKFTKFQGEVFFCLAYLILSYTHFIEKLSGKQTFSRKSVKILCLQTIFRKSGNFASHIPEKFCLFVINLRKSKPFLIFRSFVILIFIPKQFSRNCKSDLQIDEVVFLRSNVRFSIVFHFTWLVCVLSSSPSTPWIALIFSGEDG